MPTKTIHFSFFAMVCFEVVNLFFWPFWIPIFYCLSFLCRRQSLFFVLSFSSIRLAPVYGHIKTKGQIGVFNSIRYYS